MAHASPDILLVSELFPPAVGGSSVLFDGIYSRLDTLDVAVLTDSVTSPGQHSRYGHLRISRSALASDYWGLKKLRALKHHWRVGTEIKRLVERGKTLVHCGRVLPEGLGAMLGRKRLGAQYACWAHGEDIALAMESREMALWTRKISRQSLGMFANSKHTAQMLYAIGVPEDRTYVITPGVDTRVFTPEINGSEFRARHAPNGEPLLLSIGRLQRRKGFDLGIKAVAVLKNTMPDIRYVIVGGGEDEGYLKALVDQCGVSENVTVVGQVPSGDLPKYYSACDFFVHPNRIEGVDVEGFGIVFLEAAATAKAVIGGDSGGVREAVLHEKTGLLVSGEDVEELSEAMRKLIEDRAYCAELGRNGRQRVLDELTWDRAAEKMMAAHRRLSNLAFS